MTQKLRDIVSHLPVMVGYYKGMYWVEFKIPFWRGISYNFMGQTKWHTGRFTLMIMDIYYVSECGWCCGENKFYHTGLYIGHRDDCTAGAVKGMAANEGMRQ